MPAGRLLIVTVAQRRPVVAAAVDEEAVEHAGGGLDRVDVADQAGCRLGLAGGDDVLDVELAERLPVARFGAVRAAWLKMSYE